MLQVEKLSKTYKRGSREVRALKELTFTLPSRGFVFIIGKSGSGKSTLLNMLGGLDNITSGTVKFDGNDMKNFSAKDFDNYRNTYLGFVFQDYCLIEDLDVAKNIELSLDIKGDKLSAEEKTRLVDKVLESVELNLSIKKRFVKELSGGQKQRVAIARALIKNPKLILADEPTGNLDSKTSKVILKLLHKLSKDRLVVVVSHNIEDAKKYADRILELADGELVSDICKVEGYEDKLTIGRGVLTLPYDSHLSNSQLREINEKLQTQKIKKIKQRKSGFVKTRKIKVEEQTFDIEPKKMAFSSSISLSRFFLKKRTFASIFTILTISLLVFVLGLCQFFVQFDSAKTILTVLEQNQEEDLVVFKGYYDDDGNIQDQLSVEVTDEDMSNLKNTGYTGNIYKLFVNVMAYSSFNQFSGYVTQSERMSGLYTKDIVGTLLCDEEYLIKKFGIDGKLNILAGSLIGKPYGIVITDYTVDCIKNLLPAHKNSTYDNFIGRSVGMGAYVNGVIYTGYKEKYKDFFQYLEDTSAGIDRSSEKDYYKKEYYSLYNDIQNYYAMSYTIDQQYEYEYNKLENNLQTYISINNYDISVNDKKLHNMGARIFVHKTTDVSLQENEIIMRYDMFNNWFGNQFGTYTEDNYATEFEPITITLTKYDGTDDENVKYEKELVIKKLVGLDSGWGGQYTFEHFVIWTKNDDFMQEALENFKFQCGFVIDDPSQLNTIYSALDNNPYVVRSNIYSSMKNVGEIVQIFEDFFTLIVIGIGSVCIVLLVSYAYGNIKKRYYEIGILKALGATTGNVGFIFSLQTMLAGIGVSVISTILLLTMVSPINEGISSKLLEFVKLDNFKVVKILEINMGTIFINIGIISLVVILSCIIPLIKLHKVKPKNIMMNKE